MPEIQQNLSKNYGKKPMQVSWNAKRHLLRVMAI